MELLKNIIEIKRNQGIRAVYAIIMYNLFFRNKNIKYKLNWKGYKIFGDNRTASWIIYKEIIKRKLYDFPVNNVKTIVDLGSNVGISIIFFSHKYNKPLIIGVEPAEENLKFLYKNIKENNLDNVKIIEKPIWSKKETLSFIPGKLGIGNVFSDKKNNGNPYPSITMTEIIKENNLNKIDILKIDIEGAEIPLLIENNQWLEIVDNIFIEIHSRGLGSTKHTPIILKELKQKGFELEQKKEDLWWFKIKK